MNEHVSIVKSRSFVLIKSEKCTMAQDCYCWVKQDDNQSLLGAHVLFIIM